MAEPAQSGAGSYETEISLFLDTLYGAPRSAECKEGWVYTPTKDRTSNFWQEYYFQWPQQKEQIITHLLDMTKTKDCYVAPSIFKAPSAKKSAFGGTNYVWLDFDGNAPKNPPDGIPAPSIRIQSSKPGNEHWYWRLNEFETSREVVEGLTKRLAYTLDADKSGWDCNQVLRPPGTIHRTTRQRVRIVTQNDSVVSFADFINLVEVDTSEEFEIDIDETRSVNLTEVFAKYKWSKEALELFNRPKQVVGARSSALTRLGYHCFEMGMENEEAYAVLLNADDRWKKFANRDDRAKQLTKILNYCKHELARKKQFELTEETVIDFIPAGQFVNIDIKAEWVFEEFMQAVPLAVIGSLPGVGKSTMGMRLGACLATGKDFIKWANKTDKKMRVGFVSLEMDTMECVQYTKEIRSSLSGEELEWFDNNFHIFSLGYDLPLDDPKWQQKLGDEIDKHKLDFLIIDSISAATTTSESSVDNFFQWLRKDIRATREVGVLLIHHFRKTVNGDGKDRKPTISDLYGGLSVSRLATSAWGLHECDNGQIEMIHFKGRLAPKWHDFKITRAPGLAYIVGKTAERKEASDDEGPNYLKQTPFGSLS